ncbi:MAG TPA: hypothetical protein VMH89_15565 [Candidatus Acidoferrum sp.]|nr:hypothetical protein [Candidatus Acidoferrum sp.]
MARSEDTSFFLGVNYPWRNYGQDFGQTAGKHQGISTHEAQQSVTNEFAQIQRSGATIVRWFLFGDGRGGFHAEKGIAKKPDEFLFADVAAVLRLAQQHQLKLCFSLIDFLWLQEHKGKRPAHSHEHVLHFAAGRESFLQNILIPLFQEFRSHPALFAWEIANEPEWAIHEFHTIPQSTLRFQDFRVFAAEISRAVHEFGNVPVTLGSARLMWVRAWIDLALDFYQVHYYPSGEADTGRDLAKQLSSLAALDKPLWLGELPARDPAQRHYSLTQALRTCRNAGLCGAAVWRWTEPEAQGADVAIGRVESADLQAWINPEKSEGQRA